MKTLLIGMGTEQTVDSITTQKQIDEVVTLECDLEHNGERITWKDVNDIGEPRSIFQAILRDRKLRVDQHTIMADRPSFAIVTVEDDKAVRLEYYEGHDALHLEYDLRSKKLQEQKIPQNYDNES